MEYDSLIINKNKYFDGLVYQSVRLNFPKFMTGLVFKTDNIYDINFELVKFNIDYSIMYIAFSSISDLPLLLAKNYEVYKAVVKDTVVANTYVIVFRSNQEDYESFYSGEVKRFEGDIINLSSTRG